MNSVQPSAIGQNIRTSREEKLITQEQLAELVDISRTHMSNIECGKTIPSLPLIIRIATALGVSVDYLLAFGLSPSVIQNPLLQDCTTDEASILRDNLKSLKNTLKQYNISKKDEKDDL